MIPAAIPFLAPFSFLCHQRWDNIAAIQKLPSGMALLMLRHVLLQFNGINVPRILILNCPCSGLQDEIVPSAQMKGLWKIAQKTGHRLATWIDFPNGMHSKSYGCSSRTRKISSFSNDPCGCLLKDDTVAQPGYWEAIQTFLDTFMEL